MTRPPTTSSPSAPEPSASPGQQPVPEPPAGPSQATGQGRGDGDAVPRIGQSEASLLSSPSPSPSASASASALTSAPASAAAAGLTSLSASASASASSSSSSSAAAAAAAAAAASSSGSGALLSSGSGAEVTVTVRWAGKEYPVRVSPEDTVGELKRRICEATLVLPKRQKLLGLKAGAGARAMEDSTLLGQLALKPSAKIMMMGTVEEEIVAELGDAPEVADDLVLAPEESLAVQDRPENQRKLMRRAAAYKVKVLSPPRPGKKLLVLDIDYTLFDHRSTAEHPLELMRPYLHEFLAASYSEYDIIIWSATSMRWVEVKMRELGVLGHPDYSVVALLDHLAMITVHSERYGLFDCKPLGVIWAHFPEYYGPKNTIMFDDLKRNFVMNPRNGLVIRPFRKALLNRNSDTELQELTHYLLAIAELDDISALEHSQWERLLARQRRRG